MINSIRVDSSKDFNQQRLGSNKTRSKNDNTKNEEEDLLTKHS